MKKLTLFLELLLCLLLSFPAFAGIVNGNFETGDFTGWSLDTDGSPGSAADFSISGVQAARIEADYWSSPSDTTSNALDNVIFANTLFQVLDTTATSGVDLVLSFNWLYSGEDSDPLAGDIFLVGLNDGSGNYYNADGNFGFLIRPTTTYGQGLFSAILDPTTFGNVAGWSLDFQLGIGFGNNGSNGFGSYIQIDNVKLEAISNVPEPSVLALGLAGLAGLFRFKRSSLR